MKTQPPLVPTEVIDSMIGEEGRGGARGKLESINVSVFTIVVNESIPHGNICVSW